MQAAVMISMPIFDLQRFRRPSVPLIHDLEENSNWTEYVYRVFPSELGHGLKNG